MYNTFMSIVVLTDIKLYTSTSIVNLTIGESRLF